MSIRSISLSGFPIIRFVNLGLRGSTLVAKFLLLFVLAYFLEPVDVALYGLAVATIAYSLYALGFDFYSYSTREFLGNSRDQWARLLRDQAVFFGLVYCCILPLLLLIFALGMLPWFLAPWFFLLVVLEHLGQELNRMLVAMSRQLLAGVMLFLRSGVWAFAVALMFWHSEDLRSIQVVFLAWAVSAFLACLLGVFSLRSLSRKSLKEKIDWRWISIGVRVAVPLLLATLAIRAVFTIDRYWVEGIAGAEVLAAYVLYAGIANAVMAFLDAGVFVFLYPRIVSAYKNKNYEEFKSGMLALSRQTVIVSLLLCVSAAMLVHPVLGWLQKDIYYQYVNIMYVLLVAMFVFSVSMVPHYGIYAMSKDKYIVGSHLLALCIFLVAAVVLQAIMPVYAVPLALCVSFAFMGAGKFLAYSYLKKLAWAAG
ncbi:lipopolysaccharide biosynthesis protein [Billgrantia antri]|uniref:lipopolysaccharide biosynthesis protein n=1 Tax=Billgrantia antri TaxID=2846777 RepID=UPI003B228C84